MDLKDKTREFNSVSKAYGVDQTIRHGWLLLNLPNARAYASFRGKVQRRKASGKPVQRLDELFKK